MTDADKFREAFDKPPHDARYTNPQPKKTARDRYLEQRRARSAATLLKVIDGRTMKRPTALALILAAIVAIAGCESRSFTRTETLEDGRTVVTEYRRATFFGDSSSEGVSVSESADSLAIEVGATNSDADTDAFLSLSQAIVAEVLKRGLAAPPVPTP